MIRARLAPGLALAVALALGAACSSGDPSTAPATGTPSATPPATATPSPSDVSPSPTPTATATATPTPEATAPRDVPSAPSDAVWQLFEPSSDPDDDDAFRQLVYEVDADALWALSGADGDRYYLSWSPHGDAAIAIRAQATLDDESETVLLDPRTGDVRRLLPFPVGVADWPEPERLFVRVGTVIGGRDGPSGWRRGLYELDLAAETMTLLGEGDRFSQPVPVPEGSQLAPGRFERRIFPDDGWSALVYVSEDGDESFIRDRLAQTVWSPDDGRVALVGVDNLLTVFDTRTGVPYPLGPPAYWGRLSWSPDGRYLAASFSSLRGQEAVVFDLAGLDQLQFGQPLPLIGPFEAATFADWGPGETPTEALLLGDYCDPEGFLLDRLDLESGAIRRLSTESGGFWVYDWSPRGDLIAVSSWEIGSPRSTGGFALIEADSGATRSTPRLSEVVTTMQDVAWSASGDWLALNAIGGRDRCLG